MGDTRNATIDFRDEYVTDERLADNPIVFLVIAHSSIDHGEYKNPDGSSVPYSSYRWTQHDFDQRSPTFSRSNVGWFSALNVTTIDKDHQDVWAVVFKRQGYDYLEYLRSKPGFWETVEKDVVKEICDAAIEAADAFDDETTTPLLIEATDKVIDAMFRKKDGRVIIKNWVKYQPRNNNPSISFQIGETAVKIGTYINSSSSRVTPDSSHHTSCDTERFGNQDKKR